MCISSLVESSHSLAEFASHPQLSNIHFRGAAGQLMMTVFS